MRRFLLAPVLFFAPLYARAAESTFFGPIVPEQCQYQCPCGFAGVLEVARHLMNFAVTFGVIVLTIMLAWGGFMYILSAANPESRSQANKLLTGAVIGMVLVLSSWLIVDFVMRTLYSGPNGTAGKFGPWNSIIAEGTDWCIVAKKTEPLFDLFPLSDAPTTKPTTPSPNDNPVSASQSIGETRAREYLSGAGISVNKAACSATRTTNCTNVGGVQQHVLDQVVAIKDACKCSIIVTGGSESGHAGGTYSHGSGYKIDLGLNGGLNGYLEGLQRAGSRSGDPVYRDQCGNEYVRESDHWDITVNRGVCSPPR